MRTISFLRQLALLASLLRFLSGHASMGRGATLLVWPDSPDPAPPYSGWRSAAHTIQDAVDAALAGDRVLVTNGVYAQGGRSLSYLDFRDLTNRVAVDRPVTVRSVNGPEVTVIQGYQVPETTFGFDAARCAYVANGAVLAGFTLTNGATLPQFAWADIDGGTVWCEDGATVSNCVLTGNSACWGGGVRGGTLSHCILSHNSAPPALSLRIVQVQATSPTNRPLWTSPESTSGCNRTRPASTRGTTPT